MSKIKFSINKAQGDRRHYVCEDDVRTVLDRLPVEICERLKVVHFNDKSQGVKRLGYTSDSRKEIALCALPPRVSLSRFLQRGQSARLFGAERAEQWPELSVRRFMLYYVLLREIGHLQVVDPEARDDRKRFARDRKAHELAEEWRTHLWSKPFDHPDPVHNQPAQEEVQDESVS